MTTRGYKLININSKLDPTMLCVPLYWISALKCVARSINESVKFDKYLQQTVSVNKRENFMKYLNCINYLVDFVDNCVILYNTEYT